MHVADFVQPNFYSVNLSKLLVVLPVLYTLTTFIQSSHFVPMSLCHSGFLIVGLLPKIYFKTRLCLTK